MVVGPGTQLSAASPPSADASPLGGTRRLEHFLSVAGPYLGLVLVVGLFSVLIGWTQGDEGLRRFLSPGNLKLIATHAAIPAAVALGMTMIMISGGIDLSVGYVVSLVTITTMFSFRWAYDRTESVAAASLCAVAAGLGTGALVGWCNGMLITRLKVVPFVVTLGTMGVARGLAQYLANGKPIAFPRAVPPAELPPAWVPWLGAYEPQPAWIGVGPAPWSVLILGAVVAVVLRYTVLGRYCYALGSNEATARLCGIRVERTKVILYTLAGLLTGWGGILQFARSQAGLHDVAAGLELDVIAAVVIGGGSLSGGEGTVTGTLVGALMIQVLSNGCSKLELPVTFRFIIIGLILIGVSAVNAWRQRRLR